MTPARHEAPETQPEQCKADLQNLFPFQRPLDIRSVSLSGLFVLAIFYTLYFAREFILPILLAWILSSLLAPIVRTLKQIHIPEPLSALIIILALLGMSFFGVYRLYEPAGEWIQKAPQSLTGVRFKLKKIMRPVEEVQETTKEIEKMTTLGNEDKPMAVEIKKTGLGKSF